MWVFVRSLRPHTYGYFWDFIYLLCDIEGIVGFVGSGSGGFGWFWDWFWFGWDGDVDTGWDGDGDTGYLWLALYIMYR